MTQRCIIYGDQTSSVQRRAQNVMPLNCTFPPGQAEPIPRRSDKLALIYIKEADEILLENQKRMESLTKSSHNLSEAIASYTLLKEDPTLKRDQVREVKKTLARTVEEFNRNQEQRRHLTLTMDSRRQDIATMRHSMKTASRMDLLNTFCPVINKNGSFAHHFCGEDGIYQLGKQPTIQLWPLVFALLAACFVLEESFTTFHVLDWQVSRGRRSLLILTWSAFSWLSNGWSDDLGFEKVWNATGNDYEPFHTLCSDQYQ